MYIRHRERMVRESLIQDVTDTLIACRWMEGTTSKAVRDPDTGLYGVITRTADDTQELLDGWPLILVSYFPDANGVTEGKTAFNTLAVDTGTAGDVAYSELGSTLLEQPYLFNFAFYAVSDAVAQAVMADLRDRMFGRIVDMSGVPLYNFLDDPSIELLRMEVDSFRFTRDANTVSPAEVHLYFAELQMTDIVD